MATHTLKIASGASGRRKSVRPQALGDWIATFDLSRVGRKQRDGKWGFLHRCGEVYLCWHTLSGQPDIFLVLWRPEGERRALSKWSHGVVTCLIFVVARVHPASNSHFPSCKRMADSVRLIA